MALSELLSAAARAWPERPAVSVGQTVLHDHRTLARRADALAGALRGALGLAAGDRVLLWLSNAPQTVEILWGCWRAGLVVVPVNPKLHPREVAHIAADSGAALALVTDEFAANTAIVQAAAPGLRTVVAVEAPDYEALLRTAGAPPPSDALPDDPAWLFYTSGTTGRPKGATLSHRNLLGMTLRYFADVDALGDRDCLFHAAPFSHASGLMSLPFLARGANQVFPESRGFDPAEIGDLAGHWDSVSLFGAPTMVTRLVAHAGTAAMPVERIRTIVYGGAPMYVADARRALDLFGPRLCQLYGQGESPITGTVLSKAMHADTGHPAWEARLGTVGIVRTGLAMRVVDGDDRPLPPGEVGEVVFRSDVTMLGYWNNPAATAETLRGGWLHTGDLGMLDEAGFLTLLDRSKDLIISGGSNIYPREVEEVLLKHPDVAEASVVGRPHPDWGEEAVAFVAARPGSTLDERQLDALCLDHIARYKRPKAYVFVERLPKSGNGKILKSELRAMLAAGAPPSL